MNARKSDIVLKKVVISWHSIILEITLVAIIWFHAIIHNGTQVSLNTKRNFNLIISHQKITTYCGKSMKMFQKKFVRSSQTNTAKRFTQIWHNTVFKLCDILIIDLSHSDISLHKAIFNKNNNSEVLTKISDVLDAYWLRANRFCENGKYRVLACHLIFANLFSAPCCPLLE